MFGLLFAVVYANADERQQRNVDVDELSSIIQIHSSSFDANSMPNSVSIEVCKGHCMFVLSFGDTLLVMEKDGTGRVREVPTTHDDFMRDWPVRIDMETLPLDLANNPFVEIGGKEYVMSYVRGPEIWRVASDDHHREFSRKKVVASSFVGGPYVLYDPDTTPDPLPAPVECTEESEPERRNINCILVGQHDLMYYISWDECIVSNCTDGSRTTKITIRCVAKSVTLPTDIAHAIFGSGQCDV